MNPNQWLEATLEAKIAHTEARAFWRGVTASRALYVAENGERWRQSERRARDAGDTDDGNDFRHCAEAHERQAAWLRACAGAT